MLFWEGTWCRARLGLNRTLNLRAKKSALIQFWIMWRVTMEICVLFQVACCEGILLSRQEEKIKVFFLHWCVGSSHMLEFCWWFSFATRDLVKFPQELNHIKWSLWKQQPNLCLHLWDLLLSNQIAYCAFFYVCGCVLKKSAFSFLWHLNNFEVANNHHHQKKLWNFCVWNILFRVFLCQRLKSQNGPGEELGF